MSTAVVSQETRASQNSVSRITHRVTTQPARGTDPLHLREGKRADAQRLIARVTKPSPSPKHLWFHLTYKHTHSYSCGPTGASVQQPIGVQLIGRSIDWSVGWSVGRTVGNHRPANDHNTACRLPGS